MTGLEGLGARREAAGRQRRALEEAPFVSSRFHFALVGRPCLHPQGEGALPYPQAAGAGDPGRNGQGGKQSCFRQDCGNRAALAPLARDQCYPRGPRAWPVATDLSRCPDATWFLCLSGPSPVLIPCGRAAPEISPVKHLLNLGLRGLRGCQIGHLWNCR